MSRKLDIRAALDAPHAEPASPIRRVLGGYLRRRGATPPAIVANAPLWRAERFDLHRTDFLRLTTEKQASVLAACAHGLLRESYFIEKAGIAFCAKMILLSETAEERQAYALMGADEATHMAWIGPYVGDDTATAGDPFLSLVADCIEEGRRDALAFLLQIVLEGWGVTHYRGLAADCQEPSLADTFATMARDETLHCTTGTAVFDPRRMDADERAMLLDVATRFLGLVRIGPQAVAAALARGYGGLDRPAFVRLFVDLQSEERTAEKLVLLRGLFAVPDMGWLVNALDDYRLFEPLSAEACATIALGA